MLSIDKKLVHEAQPLFYYPEPYADKSRLKNHFVPRQRSTLRVHKLQNFFAEPLEAYTAIIIVHNY